MRLTPHEDTMARRRSPSTAVVAASSNTQADAELTFPAALLQPPQSQVTQYSNAVADRVAQLDLAAERLAEGFGISQTNFVLNPRKFPLPTDNVTAVGHILETFVRHEERIALERRSGRWGLYFTRVPALLDREKPAETVPLKDAPLDVRERFLARSGEFFREYLKTCADRLGKMKSSVGAADSTLQLLANLRLE
jgi:hypothetical protein